MPTDPFFDERLEWSQWKHIILKHYLHVWVNHLQRRSKHLAYIDTCAGAGTYESGEDGSPLIAARWNDEWLHALGARLVVLACESDPDTYASLARALAPWVARTPPEAAVYNLPFGDALAPLLEMTRSVPTFVFIDPYGMRSLTAEQLRPLLKDANRQPTEALVRVDPVLLARYSGWLRERPRDARGQKTAASFRRLLEGFEISAEVLARLSADDARGVGKRDVILLNEYLHLFEGRFKYVQVIPIRPGYDAAPKYMLVHGTDNPNGAAKMNDVVSRAEDELYRATEDRRGRNLGQGSLFDPPPRPRRAESVMEPFILDKLAKNPFRYIALRAELAMAFGTEFRDRHHRVAVRTLEERGVVECLDDFGQQTSRLEDKTLVRRVG